jgi:hypothetical protein
MEGGEEEDSASKQANKRNPCSWLKEAIAS